MRGWNLEAPRKSAWKLSIANVLIRQLASEVELGCPDSSGGTFSRIKFNTSRFNGTCSWTSMQKRRNCNGTLSEWVSVYWTNIPKNEREPQSDSKRLRKWHQCMWHSQFKPASSKVHSRPNLTWFCNMFLKMRPNDAIFKSNEPCCPTGRVDMH